MTPTASAKEPEITVEHREELVYLLTEAAEIEHGLMCCYLFAAYSVKTDEPELSDEERATVARFRATLLDVARDEMVHLALVSNILSAIGAPPHFARPNFPVAAGYHPADVVVSLSPLDRGTMDHFTFLERPEGVELPDGEGFVALGYRREHHDGRLVPTAQDYKTVGHLYRGIRAGLGALSRKLGESALFLGDPRLQVGPELLPMQGLTRVRSLEDAERAIDTIVAQGEGANSFEHERSHYGRFRAMRAEYGARIAQNPAFSAARPVAKNPVMRKPPEPQGKVWIDREPAATLLDLGNAAYALMLRSLQALYSPVATDDETRGALAELCVVTMRLVGPFADALTRLPASTTTNGVNAGLTFTMSRSIHPPQDARGLAMVAEGARAVILRARGLPAADAPAGTSSLLDRLSTLADTVAALSTRIPSPRAPSVRAPAPAAAAAPVPTAPVAPAASVEVARGKSLTILFEGKRCIHSRHCVVDAPGVFLANTPGEWIFPDNASTETLVAVAHACPSGAIRYERTDGGAEESAPPVNVARIRENGPNAINAQIHMSNGDRFFRATFCRCGASRNKPFCDGSHVAAKFTASGEPATVSTEALAQRGGELRVSPQKNGPLGVTGNLEICAGTGRIVNRVTRTFLCRCGGSQNKPFCDGTHAKNGFTADGD